jgi:hypothetical protein
MSSPPDLIPQALQCAAPSPPSQMKRMPTKTDQTEILICALQGLRHYVLFHENTKEGSRPNTANLYKPCNAKPSRPGVQEATHIEKETKRPLKLTEGDQSEAKKVSKRPQGPKPIENGCQKGAIIHQLLRTLGPIRDTQRFINVQHSASNKYGYWKICTST